jgi:cytochrome c oxidase assembly protein subunit 15
MSVPDWPTTLGQNMFTFPYSKWTGGIFYEHSHRLLASAVGFLTIILAVWLWLKEERRWLRWLGVAALMGVIAQGILGGLRVTAMKDAQLCFVLVCAIALFLSRWWSGEAHSAETNSHAGMQDGPFPLTQALSPGERENHKPSLGEIVSLRRLAVVSAVLIFVQLVLGATMRHQHAGLAIPDFPTAYGRLWPATDEVSVDRYNRVRLETVAVNPITATQINLQMAHRIGALAIVGAVGAVSWFAIRRLRTNLALFRLSMAWSLLVWCQAVLGAATIWTNKSPLIATAHVAFGALSLVNGAMLIMICSRYLWKNSAAVPKFSPAESHGIEKGLEVAI